MFYCLTKVIADLIGWVDEGTTTTSCLITFVASSIAS